MRKYSIIPDNEFQRIAALNLADDDRLKLIADMCRANTLTSVKIAGSGHLGSSFSAMDIVVYLYYKAMNIMEKGPGHPDRDIYFSSKGHDVPGLYSILHSIGVLPENKLLMLRRFGGLDGHPDVAIPGMEVNSGSLGMGISKGKGFAIAKKLKGYGGKVFVLTGDGELQEGQIFEALQTVSHQNINNLTVIVDHNKVQSDKRVSQILDLKDLEAKFTSFGWYVKRCNGHDFKQLEDVFSDCSQKEDQPKIIIADTVKGSGISFMEHPQALAANNGVYKWHSGAPDDQSFESGHTEIIDRINTALLNFGLDQLQIKEIRYEEKAKSGVSKEYVAHAYGQALVELAKQRSDLVVLDADLAVDCSIRDFEETYPERFFENGIAEQDMVSAAGGMALHGLLPVVNSFAAFLSSRANEQIYANTCEKSRIIYVNHYSGLIPAGPGKSHQSVRDISLLGALPNFEILQPCNAKETHMALQYCVEKSQSNCALRLVIGPSPRIIDLSSDYSLSPGIGVEVRQGEEFVLISYGPVMLHEAMRASEILEKEGVLLKVVNMPWLNRVDINWLKGVVKNCKKLFVLEDHSPVGGLGDYLLKVLVENNILNGMQFKCFGVEGFPACGTPKEVLKYHGLDGESLSRKILGQDL